MFSSSFSRISILFLLITAAWLAQLGERRTAVREVESSIPAGPTLRVLKLTEKNMLPFFNIKKWLDILVFSDRDE